MSSPELWCNPPPPGTTDVDFYDNSRSPRPRVIDQIDPYLKSTEYIKYQRRRRSRSRHRHRSRSRSKEHRHRHRRRSRSRSRRRSHRHHSRSRSRSRRNKSRRTRTRSRSRSRSRSPKFTEVKTEQEEQTDNVEEEEEEEENVNENVFKNDGTFMEMFKKMQEEQQMKQSNEQPGQTSESRLAAPPPMPVFGKRRGGKILKTGMVQKSKTSNEEEANAQDAWSLYMKEVKRYKEACCDDDSKTRLLVK